MDAQGPTGPPPYTATDKTPILYSPRLESSPLIQKLEKVMFGVVLAFGTGVVVACIVEGVKEHTEHVFMGILVLLTMIHFVITSRLYVNDYVQDRKVVYFVGLVVVFAGVVALVYATKWTAGSSEPPTTTAVPSTCQDYYNARTNVC